MIYELPLFPLNTVLFPGMPLTLHIFEERYQTMITQCLDDQRPFGVVLIKEGVEALGPLAEPHAIGCTAEIAQVQSLEDGRMNILAVGRERFQIVSLHDDRPYLRGTVETFPLETAHGDAHQAGTRLRPWVESYVGLLSEAGDVDFDTSSLPDDPEALAYLAATVLQVPNEQKQALLATRGVLPMLTAMHDIFRREMPILRLLLQEHAALPGGAASFSLS